MEQLTFTRAASDRGKTVFKCELCGRCCFIEELAHFLLVSAGQAKIMNAIDAYLRVLFYYLLLNIASYFQRCVVKFPPGVMSMFKNCGSLQRRVGDTPLEKELKSY